MKLGLVAIILLQMSTTTAAQEASRSPMWKEYVYEENGFAITLPDDPHPHKSSQMPSGTAYSIRFSNSTEFSLYTMQANNKCVDAVRGQSEKYAQYKDAPPDGFKAMSFREVTGNGYTGVEFVQQVPTGKIDYERWICGANRLYVLVSTWNPGEPEPKELRRIVDSFRVITTQ